MTSPYGQSAAINWEVYLLPPTEPKLNMAVLHSLVGIETFTVWVCPTASKPPLTLKSTPGEGLVATQRTMP